MEANESGNNGRHRSSDQPLLKLTSKGFIYSNRKAALVESGVLSGAALLIQDTPVVKELPSDERKGIKSGAE